VSLTEQERDAIADAVAAKIAAQDEGGGATGLIKTAGDALGLVAGIVALGYFVGAAVIAVRMFVEKFNPDEVAAVIGELPRETVITLGFIEGVAVAAAVGLLLGSLASANDWPHDNSSEKAIRRLGVTFALLCFVFIVGFLFVDDRDPNLWILILPVPVLMSWAAAHLGARRMVNAAKRGAGAHLKGAITGAVVTAIGIPLCVMFGPIVGFPDARVCLREGDAPLTGSLIADTGDRIILIRQPDAQRRMDSDRTVDSIPADLVGRLDYGDTAGLPDCPVPPSGEDAG
jgi:hypothetical protein